MQRRQPPCSYVYKYACMYDPIRKHLLFHCHTLHIQAGTVYIVGIYNGKKLSQVVVCSSIPGTILNTDHTYIFNITNDFKRKHTHLCIW